MATTDQKEFDENLAKEAKKFVKENCAAWCNFECCHLRACENEQIKQQIINQH